MSPSHALRSVRSLDPRSRAVARLGAAHGEHLADHPLGVRVERRVPATMPDGVTLYADIFRPHGEGPWPVLLMRQPYGRLADEKSCERRTADPQLYPHFIHQIILFTCTSDSLVIPLTSWWEDRTAFSG